MVKNIKSKFLIFCFLTLSITGFCQENYTLKGNLIGWPTEYIHLIRRGDYPGTDSVKVENGKFEFKGNIPGPTHAFLVAKMPKGDEARFLYIEPGNLEINGDFKSFKDLKVTGSPTNEDYTLIKNYNDDFEKKVRAIMKKQEAETNNEASKKYDLILDSLYASKNEFSKAFIEKHPNSVVSIPELINIFDQFDDNTIIKLYESLSNKVKSTPGGEMLAENLKEKEKIKLNEPAPDFAQPDMDGKAIKLSDYKGKYVLVDFWASWCAPCRAENPNLIYAYQKFKTKGFDILSVSIDDLKAKTLWKQAVKVDKLTWTQVADLKGAKNEAAVLYGVQQIPSNFLVNPEGIIVAKNLRGNDLIKKLEELIK